MSPKENAISTPMPKKAKEKTRGTANPDPSAPEEVLVEEPERQQLMPPIKLSRRSFQGFLYPVLQHQ
jgi:hypothetical protein